MNNPSPNASEQFRALLVEMLNEQRRDARRELLLQQARVVWLLLTLVVLGIAAAYLGHGDFLGWALMEIIALTSISAFIATRHLR